MEIYGVDAGQQLRFYRGKKILNKPLNLHLLHVELHLDGSRARLLVY